MAKIKKRKIKKQVKIVAFGFLILLGISLLLGKPEKNQTVNDVNISKYATVRYDTSNHVYLSDLDALEVLNDEKVTYANGKDIHFDKNDDGNLIKLNVDGNPKTFIKGLSAWATSSIVYDLSAIKSDDGTNITYDYFTAYLGVDASKTSTYYNGGVKFYIYTSSDGHTWEEKQKTEVLKGWDNAVPVKIDLKGAKYLKLYADQNGNNWWDHWYDDAIYADAKLVKGDYVEEQKVIDTVKPVTEYDKEIKAKDAQNNSDYEHILLKREFVNRVGYDILQALLNYSEDYQKIISWLMEDQDLLQMFLLGGEPDGNYISAINILHQLCEKYKTDLDDTENKDLYLKMMVTLSLTHSANVGTWITGAPENPDDPNGSNALNRYKIFKQLYLDGLLNNEIFTNLSVEEMRFVMNNIISDEEIEWLNHYTRDYAENKNFTTKDLQDEREKNPYTYITYTFDYDYSKDIYYLPEYKTKWDNEYFLTKYHLPYHEEKGYPKLWVVFEEGSVCGGLSKTGSNIRGVYGIPSSVVSQPGHAAYIYMSLDKNNQKVWNLYNDVSGWGQSGKTEKLWSRMPLGWGSGDYAQDYPASYVVLAQAALNEYDKYTAAFSKNVLAKVYEDDSEKSESIYREALEIQNINLDAWYGLIKSYEKRNASEEEFYELGKEIAAAYTYYPRAMYDLLTRIETHMTPKSANLANLKQVVYKSLEKASKATSEDVLQPNVSQAVAKYLLNQTDPLATFSFDGEQKNTIVLSSTFSGNKWQYSLDGGNTWTDWDKEEVTLSSEEVNKINANNDILVRIYGALDSTYGIDISEGTTPVGIYANDLENKIMGVNETMEWKRSETEPWHSFKEETPLFTEDEKVIVRNGATKTRLAGPAIEVNFTKDEIDLEHSYIPVSRLTLHKFSSEQNTTSDAAQNILDGNINTLWHTKWDKSDNERYIILKLDRPSFLSALAYVPRQDAANGRILNARISVSMDDQEYTTVVPETTWGNDATIKKVNFNESIEAMYIKIEGIKGYNDFMSGAMIELFEDRTKLQQPTAGISYSTKESTNKEVEVKLIDPSEEITITNNDGKDTYTFTDNGEFTFTFTNNIGTEGKATAKVDWIDKEKPVAKVTYNRTNPTKNEVTAELECSEKIKILNNNGESTYTFFENGSFTFSYEDAAGNQNTTVATVNWIENEIKTPAKEVSLPKLTVAKEEETTENSLEPNQNTESEEEKIKETNNNSNDESVSSPLETSEEKKLPLFVLDSITSRRKLSHLLIATSSGAILLTILFIAFRLRK